MKTQIRDFRGELMSNWNVYFCGLCEVDFAVSKKTDMGESSCPKCESGEEVVRISEDSK